MCRPLGASTTIVFTILSARRLYRVPTPFDEFDALSDDGLFSIAGSQLRLVS